MSIYAANGGQTFTPYGTRRAVPYCAHTPVPRPDPLLSDSDVIPQLKDKGWVKLMDAQHFLPGVTAEMMDWFWVNMEKAYYLWAPGSHKRFEWIDAPWQVGLVQSKCYVGENLVPDGPVLDMDFPSRRFDMDAYPFTTCLDHVIAEGFLDDQGQRVFINVHTWSDVPGGLNHRVMGCADASSTHPLVAPVASRPADAPPDPIVMEHVEYEVSRWPEFLPALFDVWKDHPDPTQNVRMDLSVRATGQYTWEYVHENGPVAEVSR